MCDAVSDLYAYLGDGLVSSSPVSEDGSEHGEVLFPELDELCKMNSKSEEISDCEESSLEAGPGDTLKLAPFSAYKITGGVFKNQSGNPNLMLRNKPSKVDFTKYAVQEELKELKSKSGAEISCQVDPKDGSTLSKTALYSRENRLKRKAYVKNLETSVEDLTVENRFLKKESVAMKRTIKVLRDEVSYLKSVIANESTLTSLLRNIGDTPGVNFGSSDVELVGKSSSDQSVCRHPSISSRGVRKGKRPVADEEENEYEEDSADESASKRLKNDHDYASDKRVALKASRQNAPAGVCLHVSNNDVSLEFCSLCSRNSAKGQGLRNRQKTA